MPKVTDRPMCRLRIPLSKRGKRIMAALTAKGFKTQAEIVRATGIHVNTVRHATQTNGPLLDTTASAFVKAGVPREDL